MTKMIDEMCFYMIILVASVLDEYLLIKSDAYSKFIILIPLKEGKNVYYF